MVETIWLHGSEDVGRAGHEMTRAASEMQHAASNISAAFEQHQRFLDDWLSRYEAIARSQNTPGTERDG